MKPASLTFSILTMGLLAGGLLTGCGSDRPDGRLPGEPIANPKETAVLRADANGDRHVTTAEYDAYVRQFFIDTDTNGSGYIDEDEWSKAQDAAGGYGIARAGFLAVDLNGDGRIGVSELTSLPRFAFYEIDTDGDGTITPKELAALPAIRGKERGGLARPDGSEGRTGDPGLPY
jgi:hypothetical protein